MSDYWLEWNNDFVVDATGDLLTVDGDDETRQRIERRLFTAVQGYLWHPEYGAGLPQKIGGTYNVEQIQAIVNSQLFLEATVAPNPPAKVIITESAGGTVVISIKYFDAVSGVSVSFQITS